MPRQLTSTPRAARPVARPRRGFSLPELLITLLLLGIVGAALIGTLAKQQKFYNHAGEVIERRSQLRQAASILPSDFRGISTVGHDLISMSATSVRMLSTFGSGVICNRPAGLTDHSFDLPPLNGVRNTYTMWATQPQPGDTVMILDEGTMRGSEDDQWLRFSVAEVTQSDTYCPSPHIYVDPTEAGRPRFRIRVALPGNSVATGVGGAAITTPVLLIPATVASPGAIVRFVRPIDYSLFQSGQDGKWYLGVREFRAGGWSNREVVSGPYSAIGGGDGLTFRYFTEGNVPVAAGGDRTTVARIDIVIRGSSVAKNQFSKTPGGKFGDSLAVRVAVRNRR